MQEKKFLIDEKLATEVLNYLAGRPYVEVYQLIAGMQQLKEPEKPKQQKDEKP